ncbi:hypothetical protein BJY52DRAFT_1201174 [Lactarius psammicola]|nr:hypothetical protein BJY52DRAFT_1201174 [Lactarius psammicola]
MSFSHLPVELLNLVCSNLSSPDLAALSSTCSLFYPIAQRILYLDSSLPPFRPFYRALANALSAMSELTTLHLSLGDTNASWVLASPTRHITYPRLHEFTSSFPFDAHVTNFLERTPALERLELDTAPVSGTAPLPPVKVIVPGRPLESIHIHDGDLTEDQVACLAQSTGHIAVLGAITSALLVPFLQSLARHLPYLAYLRLMAPFHVSSKQSDDTFYEQVASTLTSMPQLLDFELSGMHWASSCQVNGASQKRIWQAVPMNTVPDHHIEDNWDFTSDYAYVY